MSISRTLGSLPRMKKTEHIYFLHQALKSRDLDKLRKLSKTKYGFVSLDLRLKAYKLLLRCDFDEYQPCLSRKSRPGLGSLNTNLKASNSTLEASDSSNSSSSESREDIKQLPSKDLLHQIQLDVDRIFGKSMYASSDVLKQRENLVSLLTFIFQRFPGLQYYQGYHEVAAMFLPFGLLHARKLLSAISVLYLRDYMEHTMESTISHCNLLLEILKRLDPELHQHFISMGDFNTFFSVPWILTLFSHESNPFTSSENREKLFLLFDALLCSHPCFILHFCCQIIQLKRTELLACNDMSDILMIVLKIPFNELDLPLLISQADLSESTFDRLVYTKALGSLSMASTYSGKIITITCSTITTGSFYHHN